VRPGVPRPRLHTGEHLAARHDGIVPDQWPHTGLIFPAVDTAAFRAALPREGPRRHRRPGRGTRPHRRDRGTSGSSGGAALPHADVASVRLRTSCGPAGDHQTDPLAPPRVRRRSSPGPGWPRSW
jgi:hypothetical protein